MESCVCRVLSKLKVPSLPAMHLDVGSRQVVLGGDVLLQVQVGGQRHPLGVDLEDPALGLLVRQREFYLAVNASWVYVQSVNGYIYQPEIAHGTKGYARQYTSFKCQI